MGKMLSNLVHRLVQQIMWLIIKLLVKSYRIEHRNEDFKSKAQDLSPHKTFVFAVWHEQVLSVMSGQAWTEPYLALASRSKDGDYAAFIAKKLGFTPVRGSSKGRRGGDKGGKEALMEYITNLKLGKSGGITIDGPKGPRHKCKPGVAYIAQQTGSPILPVVGVALSYWEFNSWDKFKLPKPFSKIIIEYGTPILVPADANEDVISTTCQKVETELLNLENQLSGALHPK